MPFQIVHNDITKMNTDAIVNAANPALQEGGGVCGAIFREAGRRELAWECRQKAPCAVGQAVITDGYHLQARYIIHTVGPRWQGGSHGEKEQLTAAYRNALQLAREYGCRSVSFPLISSGIYGYPEEQALTVAVEAIRDSLLQYEIDIYLVVFDRQAVTLGEQRFSEIRHYIDTYYVPEPARNRQWELQEENVPLQMDYEDNDCPPSASCPPPAAGQPAASGPEKGKAAAFLRRFQTQKSRSLEELLSHMDETFSQMLLRLIDEKGYTDAEVYKRANMDRKLFSKIRSNKDYHPKKTTVFSLAIALRLSVDEAADLLKKAGYSFSDSYRQDIIVRYFLEKGEYDIFTVNEALFCFEEPLLGA